MDVYEVQRHIQEQYDTIQRIWYHGSPADAQQWNATRQSARTYWDAALTGLQALYGTLSQEQQRAFAAEVKKHLIKEPTDSLATTSTDHERLLQPLNEIRGKKVQKDMPSAADIGARKVTLEALLRVTS